jgi:hypothetical protein
MSGTQAIRPAVLLMLVLSMGACVAHNWAPGPGVSAADFEPAKARCSLLARHSGSDFAAFGSLSYVAGAALGHAIGESVRTQRDFNDCMLASGWRIADQPAGAPEAPAVAAAPPVALSVPASAAPATPPAASVPAALSASSAPRTAVRTVASGGRQRIGFFYYVNPDCTSGGYMTVRIITLPAHGELTADRGVDYTNFPKENQRYQCNLIKSPVVNVYYKSNFGYLGTDSTLIEAASPIGTTISSIYTITVK